MTKIPKLAILRFLLEDIVYHGYCIPGSCSSSLPPTPRLLKHGSCFAVEVEMLTGGHRSPLVATCQCWWEWTTYTHCRLVCPSTVARFRSLNKCGEICVQPPAINKFIFGCGLKLYRVYRSLRRCKEERRINTYCFLCFMFWTACIRWSTRICWALLLILEQR